MNEYEKVKKVVYKHVPTKRSGKSKTTLSGINLRKASDTYEKHLDTMREDDLIKFDSDSMGRAILGTVRLTGYGEEDSFNY